LQRETLNRLRYEEKFDDRTHVWLVDE
jgi:hypothetical protein